MEILWQDTKRIMGLRNPFTRYTLTNDRLFVENGVVTLTENEVLLYRVQSLELTISLEQRALRLGTIHIHSSDKSTPYLVLENIENPRKVKELIHHLVEEVKDKRHMQIIERV